MISNFFLSFTSREGRRRLETLQKPDAFKLRISSMRLFSRVRLCNYSYQNNLQAATLPNYRFLLQYIFLILHVKRCNSASSEHCEVVAKWCRISNNLSLLFKLTLHFLVEVNELTFNFQQFLDVLKNPHSKINTRRSCECMAKCSFVVFVQLLSSFSQRNWLLIIEVTVLPKMNVQMKPNIGHLHNIKPNSFLDLVRNF